MKFYKKVESCTEYQCLFAKSGEHLQVTPGMIYKMESLFVMSYIGYNKPKISKLSEASGGGGGITV